MLASDDAERTVEPFGASRARTLLLVVYIGAYSAWLLVYGLPVDRISVLLSVAIFFVVGTVGRPPEQWFRMLGDLSIVVAMWLVYEESRGLADGLGAPIQVESVRNLDRWLFAGADPTVWLQTRYLRAPGDEQWYDIVGSTVYQSHFIVLPCVTAVLWLVDRGQWLRLIRRLATVLFVACAMFVVMPTAPPWMAGGGRNASGLELQALPPLRRPAGNGWRALGMDAYVASWEHGRDWVNQVAAMPSLHSAFALLVVVFFFPSVGGVLKRGLLLLYPLAMALALVYFAEHYVVDALAGWLLVGGSFWVWDRIEHRWPTLRIDRSGTSALETPCPDPAPPAYPVGCGLEHDGAVSR